MYFAKTVHVYPGVKPSIFKGKHVLRIDEFNGDELRLLLQTASKMKQWQKEGYEFLPLKGKTLGLIFDKASTRTRVSFEVGMYQLGGISMYMNGRDLQLGRGEPISDTAKVLSRYVDAVMIRTFSHADVEEFARHATVPVINGLTDQFHPCQALADMLTIMEHKGRLEGIKIAYLGDGNNVAHSLILISALLGVEIRVATPKGYEVSSEVIKLATLYAGKSGGRVLFTQDPVEAVRDADVLYTDVWTSMGQEAETEQRLSALSPYQVNEALVQYASPDYLFMHCLPARRGEEVTADIIDGAHSVVIDQAENRMHAQKALLVSVM